MIEDLEKELSNSTLKKIEAEDLMNAYANLWRDGDFKLVLKSFENAKQRIATEALFAEEKDLKKLQGRAMTYKIIKDLAKHCYKKSLEKKDK